MEYVRHRGILNQSAGVNAPQFAARLGIEHRQRKQRRGWHQHFLGFRARLNCENIPVIPVWLVRSNLNDPRRIPYLLICKDERDGRDQGNGAALTLC